MYMRYVGCLRCCCAFQCISFSRLQVLWFH